LYLDGKCLLQLTNIWIVQSLDLLAMIEFVILPDLMVNFAKFLIYQTRMGQLAIARSWWPNHFLDPIPMFKW